MIYNTPNQNEYPFFKKIDREKRSNKNTLRKEKIRIKSQSKIINRVWIA